MYIKPTCDKWRKQVAILVLAISKVRMQEHVKCTGNDFILN